MKLGILGGGQLGRMLWEAGAEFPDLQPCPIYNESEVCPAAAVGADIHVGKISDKAELGKFLGNVDSYIFENEFLDVDAIKKASPPWTQPFPSLAGIRLAQDKLEQKKLFQKLNFPTADFVEMTPEWMKNFSVNVAELKQRWQGFVAKTARMGYDGKGNFFVKAEFPTDEMALREFCEKAFAQNSRVYAEPWVRFQKELALVSVQTWAGDYGHYPLVETQQKNGVCYLAFRAQQVESFQRQAIEIARTLGRELKILGTYAVEFFVTEDDQLLVNEMAPRVHNSGHFTLTGAKASQFAMHLKSYFTKTWDPEDFASAPAFAMINLLGPPGVQGAVKKPSNFACYWYDKTYTSPGRKLGHINAQSAWSGELSRLLQELQHQEQLWTESLL